MKKLLFLVALSGFLVGCAEQGDMTSEPATPMDTNTAPAETTPDAGTDADVETP